MIDLNKVSWGEFCLGNFFKKNVTIYKAVAYNKSDLIFSDRGAEDTITYVTRTNLNNGCSGYVKKTPLLKIEEGGALIVGDTTATCFYQNEEFVAGDHIVVLRNSNLDDYNSLFLITSILKQKSRFNYAISFKVEQILKMIVKLPSRLSNGIIEPDWALMSNYIKQEQQHVKKMLSKVTSICNNSKGKEIKYRTFRVGDIFEATATQTNEIGKFEEGEIPFICASNMNNGVQGFVKPNAHTEVEKQNCITVSSLDASSFYQDKPFVGRGHGSVNVLRHEKLNKFNALFICACIKKASFGKFDYNHQLFLNNLKNLLIKLPVDSENNIDWSYMEAFIKKAL